MKLLPEAQKAIARYHSQGAIVIGCTNQGGVAKGYKSLEDCLDEQILTAQLCPYFSYILAAHTYEEKGKGECLKIDFTDGGLMWKPMSMSDVPSRPPFRFRKPNPGMLDYGIGLAEFVLDESIDRDECLFVGDREEDEQAARAACGGLGIPFMWAHDWWEED